MSYSQTIVALLLLLILGSAIPAEARQLRRVVDTSETVELTAVNDVDVNDNKDRALRWSDKSMDHHYYGSGSGSGSHHGSSKSSKSMSSNIIFDPTALILQLV